MEACCLKLIAHVRNTPQCFLVFVSIIPSPESNPISKGPFDTWNKKMLQWRHQFPTKVGFCNLNKKLMYPGRHCMMIRSKKYFKHRDIHLNKEGAEVVAECIKQNLLFIPRSHLE